MEADQATQAKHSPSKNDPKYKEEIILEEFSGNHIKELLQLMKKDDDTAIKDEFIYPYKPE